MSRLRTNLSKSETIALIGVVVALLGVMVAWLTWLTRPRPSPVLKLIVEDENITLLRDVHIKYKFKDNTDTNVFEDKTDGNGEVTISTNSTIITVFLPDESPYKIQGGLSEFKFPPQSYGEKRITLIKKNNPLSKGTPIKIDEALVSVLEDNLKKQQWKEADKQTVIVMLQAAGLKYGGFLNKSQMERLSCQDINKIDDLWLKYSNNKFGFSVQKQILQGVGGDLDKFGDRVGWRNGDWLTYNKLNFTLGAPDGHLPSIWLPDLKGEKKLSGGWIAYNLLSDNFSKVSSCLKPVLSSDHKKEWGQNRI